MAAAALLAFLLGPAAEGASADNSIGQVSRHAGQPGEKVTVTIGCACFPPCEGPKGHLHPAGYKHGPCSPGARPPARFGVSLLPFATVKATGGCTPRTCPGTSASLPPDPSHDPYAFLGFARPPAGGNNPEHGDIPRYLLTFRIPDLRPGTYGYVFWCAACVNGHRGPLIADPVAPVSRLVVRSPLGNRPAG